MPDMAALYAGLRRERESGHPDPAALAKITEAAALHPGEWLLKAELDELRMPAHA